MLRQNEKSYLRIKNKLLPEIGSDVNHFRKIQQSEISKKNNLKNNTDSSLSNEENNEYNNDNYQYISVLNDYDILSVNSSSNNNIKKSPLAEIKGDTSPLSIYEEINLFIKNFIKDYINEQSTVAFILKEILNAVIIIIKDFTDNNNSSTNENRVNNLFVTRDEENNIKNNNLNLNLELNINSKIVFLLQIQKLNNKIKKLNEELEFYKSIIDIPKKGNFGNNFVDLFKKKYLDQKAKSKKEELNYLLCIGEQEKKINSLENELKKKKEENLPEEIIKSIRCFPNFHQYDFKEDINPKSIPLFQQIKKEKEKKKEKYFKKEIFESPKNLSYSIKNKKILFNNNSSNNRSKLLLTNPDYNRIKKSSNIIPFKTKKAEETFANFSKIKKYNMSLINDNKINTEYRNKNNSSEKKIKKKILNTDSNFHNKEEKEKYNFYEYFKDHLPKTILDNKKEFFIAHPTLNIAGVINKKDLKYIGLPKKIIKLKIHKNLEKNVMYTFPSSLNETLVNLEKLRKCKNININNNENK